MKKAGLIAFLILVAMGLLFIGVQPIVGEVQPATTPPIATESNWELLRSAMAFLNAIGIFAVLRWIISVEKRLTAIEVNCKARTRLEELNLCGSYSKSPERDNDLGGD